LEFLPEPTIYINDACGGVPICGVLPLNLVVL